jgi:6-phosphofructokinase
MRTSSFVALICSLAINGFNAFHQQPAIAEQSPQSWHVAEALDRTNSDTSDTDKLVVTQMGEKYGYKDTEGRIVIPARFDNAYDFFDGLAAVKIDHKWGYIDRSGKPIMAMKFDLASSFSSGLAAVKVGNKWGYVNHQGATTISAHFDEADTVKVGDKWGFIDREGVMKIEPTFDEVANFDENTAWVRIGKQVGYIDGTGKFTR